MEIKHIDCEITEGIGIITFRRPPSNAMNSQMLDSLGYILSRWRETESIRVIIFTGGVRNAFLTGADLDQLFGQGTTQDLINEDYNGFYGIQRMYSDIEKLPKLTIAAINGVCIGAGLELAIVCDLRIASELAYFSMPEADLGIMPTVGATQRLPRLIGVGRAKEMLYFGRRINAETALQWGLINRIVPRKGVLNAALDVARELAAKPLEPLLAMKDCINFGLEQGLDEALNYETETFIDLMKAKLLG